MQTATTKLRPSVIITGGGTAGHTNPGIAVAEALVAAGLSPSEVHFVGGKRGNEAELVPAAGFTIDLLAGRGIPRKIGLDAIRSGFSLVLGLVQGFVHMVRNRPKVVLSLGGYAAFATSAAAVILRVPLVVTEQNARASAVNRLMGRWAKKCALPFPDTDLPNGVLTGNPSLAAVVSAVEGAERVRARLELGLPTDRLVVAIWSGSLGATSVNNAARGLATRWADRDDIAIRHIVGRRDWERFKEAPPEVTAGELIYQTIEYETQMPLVLVAADVAVTRAGASTVAELAIAGLPSVLVPLPHAPRDHQRANTAEVVAAGGAFAVEDSTLGPSVLEAELNKILADRATLEAMSKASSSVARPDAAARVAELVLASGGITPGASGPTTQGGTVANR